MSTYTCPHCGQHDLSTQRRHNCPKLPSLSIPLGPPRSMDPCANEYIARLSRELEALRRIAGDLHWMARRYVDGRSSYATGLFNAHTRALITMGVELNPTGDGTIWARDAMGRAYDGLSEEEAALGLPAPDGLHDEDVARLRRELEAARELLRELAGDDEAGLAWDGGWRCVYCDSRARYTVLHDGECPIARARRALADTDTEGGS